MVFSPKTVAPGSGITATRIRLIAAHLGRHWRHKQVLAGLGGAGKADLLVRPHLQPTPDVLADQGVVQVRRQGQRAGGGPPRPGRRYQGLRCGNDTARAPLQAATALAQHLASKLPLRPCDPAGQSMQVHVCSCCKPGPKRGLEYRQASSTTANQAACSAGVCNTDSVRGACEKRSAAFSHA